MKRGTRVGQAYVAGSVDMDGANEDITDEFEKAGPGVEKAGKEHGDKYSEGFFGRIRANFKKGFDEAIENKAAARRAGGEMGAEIAEGIKERLGEGGFDVLRGSLLKDLDAVNDRMTDLRRRMDKARSPNSIDRLTASLKEARAESTRLTGQLRTLAVQQTRMMTKAAVSGNRGGRNDGFDLGDRIGRAFGAGSRNNFLNIFGKSLGRIINLTESARVGVTSLARTFTTAAASAEGFSKVTAGFSAVGAQVATKLGAGLASVAAGGPAAVVAVLAIITVLSVLASVVGALVALVTALASAIVSALVASLLVLGATIGAVVAGAGLLTAAFMAMTDAQKALLKEAFLPLRAEMVGIGQIMLQQMVPAFKVWSENLQQALLLLAPVAHVMGAAFAEAGRILTASFSGPGFQAFATALGVYLPSIVTSLSTALGNFLNGLLGLFALLMPYVDNFAWYLGQVAIRFNEFANGTNFNGGQNRIVRFMDEAMGALQSLWNAIREFSGFIFDVLFSPEAMGAGQTVFDGLANAFAGMRDAVAEAAANGDLQKWFDDAIRFGSALWDVIVGLYDVFIALYNSGVLNAISASLSFVAQGLQWVANGVGPLVQALGWALSPIIVAANAMIKLGEAVNWVKGLLGMGGGGGGGGLDVSGVFSGFQRIVGQAQNTLRMATAPKFSIGGLRSSGSRALAGTSSGGGGSPTFNTSRGVKKTAKETEKILKGLNKQISAALKDAAASVDPQEVRDNLKEMIDAMTDAEKNMIKAGKRRSDAVQKMLYGQRARSGSRINALEQGLKVSNATLADYAAARERIALRIEEANQNLADAISMRDDYAKATTAAARTFGALTNAQAQTINGIEQSLTATDITTTLQDRLAKIQSFQSNLNLLLAQGLSQSAYKQIVDAGVEGGAAYAEALLAGGPGAVGQVNSLVGAIDNASDYLGSSAASALYQAGVDAAQGLLDGLMSLDAQLETAATTLGNKIAAAVKRALGIKSPSVVMKELMNSVGDGAVLGLDSQHVKVSAAAGRLADQVAVSPEVARYAAEQGQPATVSGNDSGNTYVDIDVITPTEDPHAVAMEVMNEVTGRL